MIRYPASQPAPEWTAGRRYRARACRWIVGGFSLLEIIIVLAILSVLAVVAMPTVTSMMREAEMREPVERLQELAKGARLSAMLEGYPYEIIFTAEGFEARRFRLRSEEEAGEEEAEESEETSEDKKREEEDNPEEADSSDENSDEDEEDEKPPKLSLPELEEYRFSAPMACRLLFWGRTRWAEPAVELHKERIAVNDRWIFQPSGVCNPLRVQFYRGDDWIEIAFNPLTADIQSERSFTAE